jgi:hypothetical protein
MTPTQAVQLAGYIRAHFPSQPIDDYTADALGELLEPYPLEDCRAAVLRLAMRNHEGDAGKPKWCTPTDVYGEVRRQRAKRIAEAEPVELGDLDPDNTAAYIERLVRARQALAAGDYHEPSRGELVKRDIRELGQAKSVDSALATRPLREAHAEAKRELQAADAERKQQQRERQAELEAMRAADRAARDAMTANSDTPANATAAAGTENDESEAS